MLFVGHLLTPGARMIKYQRMETEHNDFADETPTVTLARSEWAPGEVAWFALASARATERALTDERDNANRAAHAARTMAVAS